MPPQTVTHIDGNYLAFLSALGALFRSRSISAGMRSAGVRPSSLRRFAAAAVSPSTARLQAAALRWPACRTMSPIGISRLRIRSGRICRKTADASRWRPRSEYISASGSESLQGAPGSAASAAKCSSARVVALLVERALNHVKLPSTFGRGEADDVQLDRKSRVHPDFAGDAGGHCKLNDVVPGRKWRAGESSRGPSHRQR